MSYDILAHFIKMGGTVFFTGFFTLTILYALWPKNKARFERAAQLPLAVSYTHLTLPTNLRVVPLGVARTGLTKQ